MAKTVTLRIDNAVYKFFTERAQAERRSLSNYIEISAMEYAKETAFADDNEMTEIRGNKTLIKNLKTGSRQAAKMKGRFVE